MRERDLDAAGIQTAELRRSYESCRRLNAQHGKTYYLATMLLPKDRRPFVHALYGFARYADDIVDSMTPRAVESRAAALDQLSRRFLSDFKNGSSSHPIFAATIDTAVRWRIPQEHFEAFLDAMRMDLHITSYATFEDLHKYVYGSAAVIGLQMLPLLDPIDDEAAPYACNLGIAFQLANFIRDVGEDLDRGRIYFPLDELNEFGVTPEILRQRIVTADVRAALAYQVARVRDIQRAARPGIALLSPETQPCIDAARILYCGIVDEVENIDYQVFDRRATVPLSRRLQVAGSAWYRTRRPGRRRALNA